MEKKGAAAYVILSQWLTTVTSGQQRPDPPTHGKVLMAQKRGSVTPTKEVMTAARTATKIELMRTMDTEKRALASGPHPPPASFGGTAQPLLILSLRKNVEPRVSVCPPTHAVGLETPDHPSRDMLRVRGGGLEGNRVLDWKRMKNVVSSCRGGVGLERGGNREVRKHNWNVNVTQCPSGTGCPCGPRSQARPWKSTQRQIGSCTRSPQELGSCLPDSLGTYTACVHLCSHHLVLQRGTQATCLGEPPLKRGGLPQTQLLRENQSGSRTAHQLPRVPTSHTAGSLTNLGLCAIFSEAGITLVSINCRQKILPLLCVPGIGCI